MAPQIGKSPGFDLQYQPTQEIRYAVVMYGGVSLAIYMNGIAQELLRMVRSTAPLEAHDHSAGSQAPLLPPADLKQESTSQVYRKIGQILSQGERVKNLDEVTDDSPILTRFVVDILSGTSAGGINAIYLSKALANNQPLGLLEDLWMKEADIDKLLNDAKSFHNSLPSRRTTSSLLNSQRMYHKLFSAFQLMDEAGGARQQGYSSPLVDELDLFVTATDLQGIEVPISTTDLVVKERLHKIDFSFSCRHRKPRVNHFMHGYNGMLAFAARCTSSFPVAFEPMKLSDVKRVPELSEADFTTKYWKPFFPIYLNAQEFDRNYVERELADGGYLQNKPFRYALDSIKYRDAWGPVDRKLLFLEPFPEDTSATRTNVPTNFISNLIKAASTLPSYQAILQDLSALNARNRQIYRIQALRQRLDLEGQEPTWKPHDSGSFASETLDSLIEERGNCFATYHHLRVFQVTDELARLVTSLLGFSKDSDEFRAVRHLVRAWREARYDPNPPDQEKASETKFLLEFDLAYRMRRLDNLRLRIDRRLGEVRAEFSAAQDSDSSRHTSPRVVELKVIRSKVQEALQNIKETCDELWARELEPSPLREKLRGHIAAFSISLDEINEILSPPSESASYARAVDLLGRKEAEFRERQAGRVELPLDALAQELANELAQTFARSYSKVRSALGLTRKSGLTQTQVELKAAYNVFDYFDSLIFPVLSSMEVGEGDEVETYRVSPFDADFSNQARDRGGKEKLAGSALMHFGAFLKEEWRENDIMWGRLDGAERIIDSLLPGDHLAGIRAELTRQAHEIIISECFTPQRQAEFFEMLSTCLPMAGESRSEGFDLKSLMQRVRLEVAEDPNSVVALLLRNALDDPKRHDLFRRAYRKPSPPTPERNLERTRRAIKILGQMIKGLDRGDGQMTKWGARLARAGGFLGSIVELSLPESRLGRLRNRFFGFLASASGLLLIAGYLGNEAVKYTGWAWLGVTVLLYLVTLAIQSFLGLFTKPGLFRHIFFLILLVTAGILYLIPRFGYGEYSARGALALAVVAVVGWIVSWFFRKPGYGVSD